MRSSPWITFAGGRPKVRRPDIRRAKQLLGWEPKVELEDGLRRTIEYFQLVVWEWEHIE
jgi:nucleoside-diphosphate-sugar epimerase